MALSSTQLTSWGQKEPQEADFYCLFSILSSWPEQGKGLDSLHHFQLKFLDSEFWGRAVWGYKTDALYRSLSLSLCFAHLHLPPIKWGNNIIILSREDREFVRGRTRGFWEHYHYATLFISHFHLSISLVIPHLPCFFLITLLKLTFFLLVFSFFLSQSFSISFYTCQKWQSSFIIRSRFPPVTVLTNQGKDIHIHTHTNQTNT